jgi:hypothetical protein
MKNKRKTDDVGGKPFLGALKLINKVIHSNYERKKSESDEILVAGF